MSFLHGVETIELPSANRPVRGVKTAVIGLVGTAPIHMVASADRTINRNVLVLSDVDAVKYFGPTTLAGYTIPKALAAAFAQGVGTVVVVNVFDPATDATVVAAADLPIASGRIALTHGDLTALSVRAAGGAGSPLVEGTDYSVNRETGVITVLAGGALAAAVQANVGYSYGNPSAIVAADIIGTVDVSGARTGMQCWRDSFAQFGFSPKILEAPAYSTQASVVAALGVMAQASRCRAIYLCDAPVGTTVQEAIQGRGASGDINFNISDDRGYLLFPYLSVYNAVTNANELQPYSQFMAGVIAATDVERGFWVSPSNKVIEGIVGTEVPIHASLTDPTCEANALNAAGITTVFNSFGTGFRTWGNRSAAYPGSGDIKTFLVARRIADQVHESLELAMLDYLDEPVTDAVIKSVEQAGNEYVRTLQNRGALAAGSGVVFNTAKNPASELALGHMTFDIVQCPNPPAERITFESTVDITLLQRA